MTTTGPGRDVDVSTARLIRLAVAKGDVELVAALTEFIRTVESSVQSAVDAAADRLAQDRQLKAGDYAAPN